MKRKAWIAMIMTMALTSGMMTGCGSSEGSAESTSAGQEASSEKGSADATGETVELELFSSKTENAATLQKIIDGFMAENADVKITLTSEADANTVLKTRLTKNDIPEIIAMGGDAHYTELQGAGVLLDLSGEDFISEVQPAYLEMVYDVNANQEQAGIQPFELTFADSWTCLPPWNSMAPVIPDANFTSDRKEGKTTFEGTHEEVLEKFLIIMEHAQDDFMGTTYNDGNVAFANGEAAMMINGNWAVSEFLNTNPDLNVNMFAFPSVDDADKNTVTSGVDVLFAVSSQGTEAQQAASKKFISYVLKAEVAQSYIDEQFAFSAVKGVEQQNKTVIGLAEDIEAGRVSNFPDHYYPDGFDLSSILQQCALNKVNGMDDAQNIQETLAECDEQYDVANVE